MISKIGKITLCILNNEHSNVYIFTKRVQGNKKKNAAQNFKVLTMVKIRKHVAQVLILFNFYFKFDCKEIGASILNVTLI